MPTTTYSTLTLPDQLAASLVEWFDAHRPTGFPTAAVLPCVAAVRGGVASLPVLVVGASAFEPHPAMTDSGDVTVAFDLLTPWGTTDEAAANDANHRAWAALARTAFAGLTMGPGPLKFMWIHNHEDAGREQTPQDTHAMTRLSRTFTVSLGPEVV
jgi:hypothetical protein